MFLHGHADQLLGHFHGDLVVADEQELGFLAHAGHQLGVALGVGVVQRRVHLVQQAKRRGVELEDGKHQRNGRERLLATREQVNGLVLLAGRLRHHLHARIQNLVAGDDELGLPAPEQLREHAAEVPVHRFKRARQQLARFAVDLADRVFQRVHGLGQIGGLRVQKHLAFTRQVQFIQRSQVDGAQRGNFAVQAVNFALQALHAHVAVGNGFFDGLQVGLRVGQQRGVLLQAQARGLFLELEFGDALAQRVQRPLQLHAALVAGAQLGRQVVVFAALGRQGFFAVHLQVQRLLQAALRRGV